MVVDGEGEVFRLLDLHPAARGCKVGAKTKQRQKELELAFTHKSRDAFCSYAGLDGGEIGDATARGNYSTLVAYGRILLAVC